MLHTFAIFIKIVVSCGAKKYRKNEKGQGDFIINSHFLTLVRQIKIGLPFHSDIPTDFEIDYFNIKLCLFLSVFYYFRSVCGLFDHFLGDQPSIFA